MRKIGYALMAAVLVASLAAPASASKPLPDQAPPVERGHKVTICHATSSVKVSRFWRIITVDVASSGGRQKLRGHVRHLEDAKRDGRMDVIPTFTYGGDTFAPVVNGPGNAEQWAAFVAIRPRAADCLGVVTPPPT
jgi:hypothetical protein